jgi:glucose/arabinose dehydrogenase
MLQPVFHWRSARIGLLALACASSATLSARAAETFDPMSQVGANPLLPPLQQYLVPPMHLARVVGWKSGEMPTVAPGLKIEALAQGLAHPRSVYVLPNGDILVVESKSPNVQPIARPKDIVMGWVESWVTSGGNTGESNRITLLRKASGEGKPQTQSIFLDHLASPFGVALVGSDLYVANTDAIVRFTYNEGDTKISSPGAQLTPLRGGPIDHHWTKSLPR